MNAIYDLYDEVAEYGNQPAEWYEKMVHKIPSAPVFDRAEYLTKAARNKVVLDVGASGPMSFKLQDVAAEYHGIGIDDNPGFDNYYQLNIDHASHHDWPEIAELDVVIAGEILEHVSNAGWLLAQLYLYDRPIIVTVPNAFSIGGLNYLRKGIECVNGEHVAWYSYQTLRTLVRRHGFRVLLWGWYNGKPLTAEGIIFHMEPDHGND